VRRRRKGDGNGDVGREQKKGENTHSRKSTREGKYVHKEEGAVKKYVREEEYTNMSQ
jgi:hypothetical protein